MTRLQILRLRGRSAERLTDAVAEEAPLALFAGSIRLGTLLCTPWDLEDLVWGYLLTSGLVREAADVRAVRIERAAGAGGRPAGPQDTLLTARVELAPGLAEDFLRLDPVIGSACGSLPLGSLPLAERPEASGAAPPAPIPAARVLALMAAFTHASPEFAATGAVHSAAIAAAEAPCTEDGARSSADGTALAPTGAPGSAPFLVLREDIGRHNAADKAAGFLFRRGLPTAGRLLLTSGRVSSEVVVKAVRCGFAAVVSRGAPTDRAVVLAREHGLTLIGFARGSRLNLYSGEGRIGAG